MSLKTFFVKYSNELIHVIHAELDSVEQFCNQHFGTTWGVAHDAGAQVVMTDHNPDAQPEDMPGHTPAPPVKTAEELAAEQAAAQKAADDAAAAAAAAQAQAQADAAAAAAAAQVPTGDVNVQLTGAEAPTATGGPSA